MNRAFAEATWNCSRWKGLYLGANPAIEEQRAIVRDTTFRRDEAEAEVDDAK